MFGEGVKDLLRPADWNPARLVAAPGISTMLPLSTLFLDAKTGSQRYYGVACILGEAVTWLTSVWGHAKEVPFLLYGYLARCLRGGVYG